MSTKTELNIEWATESGLVNSGKGTSESRQVEFLKKKEHYNTSLKFKVLPANSQENGHLGVVTARHWNIGPNNEIMSCLCVEKMFPDKHVECPVCKLKRELKAMGFTDDDLTKPGQYGPIDVFAPQLQTNLKVVMIDSDGTTNNWDQSHVSVLSMNGEALLRWLITSYLSQDVPNFLDIENGNLIKMSRESEKGKWDKLIMDSAIKWEHTPEMLEKIKAENEALTLADVWKFPSDEEFLKLQNVCAQWKEQFLAGKQTMTEATTQTVDAIVNDAMPF